MVSKNAIRWRLKQIWDISSFGTPLPYRLPYGSRWLLGRDAIDYLLFSTGDWEPEVWRFVDRFLRQGMTMLDVGAHHGFYTLLASKCVGSEGKVFAFEPAEPQRKKLLKHLRLNHCRNVQVEISA
ncbi:MAG: FkbM family methyltransferase, partial [Candidatus Omnitrophica bacterium]|nr:FkbM family methyltransferase [Candidatus Omnitrophota bacterium]